ncbi:MAG: sulfatase-like hydrolase/transferase, partial [Myxococcota bacterium]
YRTGAFVSSSVLHGSHGLASWFHTYRDELGRAPGRQHLLFNRALFDPEELGRLQKQPGDRTVERALSWLDASGSEPVFLWVHLYDPHAPHTDRARVGGPTGAFDQLPSVCEYAGHPAQRARASSRLLFSRKPALVDPEACRALGHRALAARVGSYAAEVAFADAQVATLIEGLVDRDRWSDTALIVAADHGESLTEHQQTVSHQFSLYEPVLRVPLLLRLPAGRGGYPAVVTQPVGTVQIAATLAEIAGVQPGSGAGVGLLAVAGGAPPDGRAEVSVAPAPVRYDGVRHSTAVRIGPHKVIALGGGRYERYDLIADPLERFPLRASADSPTPAPPERPSRPKRTSVPMPLPGLPDPMRMLEKMAQPALPNPDHETAWRPLDPDQEPAFGPLEKRASTVLDAVELGLSEDKVDPSLPSEVQKALEALGYLH